MSSSYAKYSEKYWLKDLKFTDNSVAKLELVDITFMISSPGGALRGWIRVRLLVMRFKRTGGPIYFRS